MTNATVARLFPRYMGNNTKVKDWRFQLRKENWRAAKRRVMARLMYAANEASACDKNLGRYIIALEQIPAIYFRGSLGAIYVPAVGRDRCPDGPYLRRTEALPPDYQEVPLPVRWNLSLFSPSIGALLLIIDAALRIQTSSDLRQSLSTQIASLATTDTRRLRLSPLAISLNHLLRRRVLNYVCENVKRNSQLK